MSKVLNIATSPHIHAGGSVPKIMFEVLLALVPAIAAAVYFFGGRVLLILGVSVACSALAEHLCQKIRRRPSTIADGSAVVTGVIFALTLPPALPLWTVAIGAVVGIVLGKMVFGGLGHNKFNPALVGRAFLQAAFPVQMTTWSVPASGFLTAALDGVTGATPLAAMKFQQAATASSDLFLGSVSGSLGETSVLAIALGGIYLMARRIAEWRIVAGVIAGAAAFSGILWLVDSTRYASPIFHLLAGGFMLGTFFMATDMVASPTAVTGRWLYGLGIGALIILIRSFSGLPEGVMYAILLMNALSPLIERYTQALPFGHARQKPGLLRR